MTKKHLLLIAILSILAIVTYNLAYIVMKSDSSDIIKYFSVSTLLIFTAFLITCCICTIRNQKKRKTKR